MNWVLRGLSDFALPYLDDITIFSSNWKGHLYYKRSVFLRLRETGATVKTEKCQLGTAEVTYLGHVVGQRCRRPSETKIDAVANYLRPQTKKGIRGFLGLNGII